MPCIVRQCPRCQRNVSHLHWINLAGRRYTELCVDCVADLNHYLWHLVAHNEYVTALVADWVKKEKKTG